MIAGERVDVSSLAEQRTRYFKRSLLVSVLLHGLITVFLANRENIGSKVRVVPTQAIRSYLYQAHPMPARSAATTQQDSGPVTSAIPKVTEIANHAQSVKKTVKKKAVKKQPNSPSIPSTIVSTSAVESMPITADFTATERFMNTLAGHCTPSQERSEIHNCDHSSVQSSSRRNPRRFERDLAVIFERPPVYKAVKLKRDLARVEQLTSELKNLDEMIGSAGVESEFLRERQRQLNQEIHRIDSQYQEINLLDVLGSGIKTVKKGYEAIRDKK